MPVDPDVVEQTAALDLSVLLPVLLAAAAIVGPILSFLVAFKLGIHPTQGALIKTLNDTIGAQRERIAVLERENEHLREEVRIERAERQRLERRVGKLERLIVDKFLALSSEQIDKLLDAMADTEPPAEPEAQP